MARLRSWRPGTVLSTAWANRPTRRAPSTAAAGHSFTNSHRDPKGRREGSSHTAEPDGRSGENAQKTASHTKAPAAVAAREGRAVLTGLVAAHLESTELPMWKIHVGMQDLSGTPRCLQKSLKPISTRSKYGQGTSAEPLKSVRHASCRYDMHHLRRKRKTMTHTK